MTATSRFDNVFSEIMAEYKRTNPEKANIFLRMKEESRERRVILYGAGGNCEYALYCCKFSDLRASGICDSHKTGIYEYDNIKYAIIPPENLLKNYSDAFVLITPWQFEQEIAASLREMGFPPEQIFFFRSPITMHPNDFTDKYLDGYRWAYDFFQDENSRRKILERIRLYFLGEHVPANSHWQEAYFGYPELSFGKSEIFVDGGGYVGDTAQQFIQRVRMGYQHIYFFEPDADNCAKARRNLAGLANVDILNMGLWDERTELTFNMETNPNYRLGGNFIAGTANERGKQKVTLPVTSLDAFFANARPNDLPTFIKIDIEGAEKKALLGGASVIRQAKPKLAIGLYHRPEDMYELPRTIMQIRDDYRMSLWQVGDCFWELALYAL